VITQHGEDGSFLEPIPLPIIGKVALVTAPWIGIESFHKPGSIGISVNIAYQLQKETLCLHKDGSVSSTE